MKFIVDRGHTLGKFRRAASGGVVIPATLARTGILEYRDTAGKAIRHLNTDAVLQESLPQLDTVVVTWNHPAAGVNPKNYRRESRGHVVGGTARFEDGHIHADLAILDDELIAAIEAGELKEISMGYWVDLDPTPGSFEDEQYDVVRTAIVWNHAAVVRAGRAGETVSLMLDESELQEDEMKPLKIKGKEVKVDEAQAVIDSLEGELEAATSASEDLRAKLKEAEEKLAAATQTKDSDFEAEVQKRVAALDAKRKEESEEAALKARIAEAYPKMALDGKSLDFLRGVATRLDDESADVAAGRARGTTQDTKPKTLAEARAESKAKAAQG